MKVLGNRVLVEQTSTRKQSAIHMIGENNNTQVFDIEFKIIGLGDEVQLNKFAIDDKIVINQHAHPNPIKQIKKTENESIYHLIVYVEDIEAILEEGETLG